tara:strand:- start:158 stop:283 length:126 start_codon:yes stop_codon:yes gene_type:complete
VIYTVVEKFKRISPYLLVLYMGWSIAVDVTALGFLLWYLFK